MVRSLNKVMIIGRLGRDPEMRFTATGRAVRTFNVATTRGWTGNDGVNHEDVEWFHVIAWGNLAELCKKRLHKGSLVYVEGRLQTRSWKTAEGDTHYRTELVAQELIFLEDTTAEMGDNEEEPGLEEFPPVSDETPLEA